MCVSCCVGKALVAILDPTEKLWHLGSQSAPGTHDARWPWRLPPLSDLELERQLSVNVEVGVLPKN